MEPFVRRGELSTSLVLIGHTVIRRKLSPLPPFSLAFPMNESVFPSSLLLYQLTAVAVPHRGLM